MIDFLAFCGYNYFHNHGFGGSKKNRIGVIQKQVMKNSFGQCAETAILIFLFLAVALLYLRFYVENEMISTLKGTKQYLSSSSSVGQESQSPVDGPTRQ